MSVSDVSQKAIGNLGWTDIKLTAPVFVGDTIYAESEVLGKRESAKRPTQGIVTVKTLGKKADGTQFMSFDRNILIPKRGPRRRRQRPIIEAGRFPTNAIRNLQQHKFGERRQPWLINDQFCLARNVPCGRRAGHAEIFQCQTS